MRGYRFAGAEPDASPPPDLARGEHFVLSSIFYVYLFTSALHDLNEGYRFAGAEPNASPPPDLARGEHSDISSIVYVYLFKNALHDPN